MPDTVSGTPPALKRRSRWRAGLLLSACLLLLLTLAAEAAQRRIESAPVQYVSDPWGMKYALTTWQRRGWVEGMAPTEIQGSHRVIAVGDSLTYGWNVSHTQAWPEQLRLLLQPRPVEILNFGVPGYDAEQIATLVEQRLDAWEPDVLLWCTYTNDIYPTYTYQSARLNAPVFVGTSIPAEARIVPDAVGLPLVAHSALFRLLQGGVLARTQFTNHPGMDWYDGWLGRIQRWADANDVPLLVLAMAPHILARPERCGDLGPDPYWCRSSEMYYGQITATLRQHGLQWIDGLAAFQEQSRQTGQESWFPPQLRDPDHPSAEGHALMARTIAPALAELIDRLPGHAWTPAGTPGRQRPPRQRRPR